MLARAKKKGFTLLELIVVLLVIGILAAIAVPTYDAVKDNSAKRTVMSTAEGIARDANAMARSGDDAVSDTTDTDLEAAAAEAGLSGVMTWTGTDFSAAVGPPKLTASGGLVKYSSGSRCFSVKIQVEDRTGDDDAAIVLGPPTSC